MRLSRAASLALLLAALLTACSGPGADSPPGQPYVKPSTDPQGTTPSPVAVQFVLYEGPPGFRMPDAARSLAPGGNAAVGLGSVELDVLLPGVTQQAARDGVKVKGAQVQAQQWDPERGLGLRIGPGRAGEKVTVTASLPGTPVATLTLERVAPATVEVDQRYGKAWSVVTSLNSHASPGPSEVRLRFSKPVRREEVEQALIQAQSTPVRGLMQWVDDQTLVWDIADLPPRLDFLLGGAHDQDGRPLPGGIFSLRVGSPPTLVAADLAGQTEAELAKLPPDIVSASLAQDAKHINLQAWVPGTTRWDWRTADQALEIETGTFRPGRAGAPQLRMSGDLENWVVNPQSTMVAGLRGTDLVVMDLRGGRQQVYANFIARPAAMQRGDFTAHLAWSPDGLKIAGLNGQGVAPAELVAVELPAGERTVLVPSLPVPSIGTRLAWSGDGRYMLAGNLLVDVGAGSFRSLAGEPARAHGAWEPKGDRLLYNVEDWGQVLLVDPVSAQVQEMGPGMVVGWAGSGKVYLLRWPASDSRYLPPGL